MNAIPHEHRSTAVVCAYRAAGSLQQIKAAQNKDVVFTAQWGVQVDQGSTKAMRPAVTAFTTKALMHDHWNQFKLIWLKDGVLYSILQYFHETKLIYEDRTLFDNCNGTEKDWSNDSSIAIHPRAENA